MITDFFLALWQTVAMWFLGLFGEYDGLPMEVEDAVAGISNLFSSSAAFFGALDHWFPVGPFLTVAVVALTVELSIAVIRGVRTVKQLLPFQ